VIWDAVTWDTVIWDALMGLGLTAAAEGWARLLVQPAGRAVRLVSG
jgi:hypothetical protein